MAGNTLAALSIATPENSGVQAFQASQSNALNQRGARMQQEAAAFEKWAQVGLGIMGGNPDGEINQQALGQLLEMSAGDPLAERLKANPELLRTITKGSLSVLSATRDEARFEMEKQRFEAELAAAQQPAKAPPVEEFFDEETGMPYKATWDAASGKYVRVGGVKAATPGQTINVNTGEPLGGASAREFQTKLGGLMATKYDQITKDADSARGSLGTLDLMEDAVASDGFYSGIGAEQVLFLKQAAAAFGIDPDGVKDMESFSALNKQAALQSMGGSLGAGFSNADRDFVTGQVANLSNTPEGNLKIIDIQRKIAQRKIEMAKMATAYVQQFGVLDAGFEKQVAQFAEENPLFADVANEGGPSPDAAPDAGGVVDWTDYFD